MECKKCGTNNLDGAQYCQNCGSKLKPKISGGFSWKNAKTYAGLGHKGSSLTSFNILALILLKDAADCTTI